MIIGFKSGTLQQRNARPHHVAELDLAAGSVLCNGVRVWQCADPTALSRPGTCLWLQVDTASKAVRLRVNDADLGVIHTLSGRLYLPVWASVARLYGGDTFEQL